MIQGISKLFIKEGHTQEFIDIFLEIIEPTRKEQGCLQFEIFGDVVEESILFVLEKWETYDQFGDHINTEHFNRIYPMLECLMIQEADITVCEKL